MTDGKLGLGATVWAALWAPSRLFDAFRAGKLTLRPFPTYVMASWLVGVGAGIQLAGLGQEVAGIAAGIFTLVTAPLSWWIDVRVTHRLTRWCGGQGAPDDTRAAIGYGAIPAVLSAAPYGAIPAALWSLFVRARGLRYLHEVRSGRAWIAAASSTVSLVVVPLLLAIGLRLTVIEAFKVPAGSMFPSIEIGDHLFVAKSTYGVFEKSLPARGDVVVFEYPEPNPAVERVDYVKRVIALPGDRLEFDSGVPIINGWRVPSCKLGRASAVLGYDLEAGDFEVVVEFLDGKAYLVAFEESHSDGRQGPFVVKPGEFWVVGDNRNNSSDSRAWNQGRGGGVPVDNLKGRARWLWLPTERLGVDLAGKPVLPRAIEQLRPELERCLEAVPDLAHTTPPPPK